MGTQSILFGAHQFLIHPIFMAMAWKRLYGSMPDHAAIYLAFVVHDWGYWGLREMDGEEGEDHPVRGANIVAVFFGDDVPDKYLPAGWTHEFHGNYGWWEFCAYHSRSYADKWGAPTSMLMPVDKCATAMYPRILYWLMCSLTGEWVEYKERWIKSGTYPGKESDGCWQWAGHLLKEWARFRTPGAEGGKSFHALKK